MNKTKAIWVKTVLLLYLFTFLPLSTANAVPARPNMFRTLKLSDGTTVEARLVGDEFGHYWLTKDGRTFRKTKSGFTPIDTKKVDEKAQKRRSAANQHRAKRQARKARPQLMAAQKIGQVGNYVGEK
ncbi:MAG: hypothetical protein IKZ83_02295, partial [Prevotella sp.]|nr:hypothetical protein [Prevotella sp.]